MDYQRKRRKLCNHISDSATTGEGIFLLLMVFDHLFLPPGTFRTTEFTSPLCLHYNCCRWNNLFTFGPRISVRLSWDWGSVCSISSTACVRQIGHAMLKYYYFCDHPVPTPPPLYDSGQWWWCCLQANTIHREREKKGKVTRRRRLGGPNYKKAHSCCRVSQSQLRIGTVKVCNNSPRQTNRQTDRPTACL